MSDPQLLDRAAECYVKAGLPLEAARCYREAGSYLRSANLFVQLDGYREAAEDFTQAGLDDRASWVLVHLGGDPAAARARLGEGGVDPGATAEAASGSELRRRVVLARCATAEGSGTAEEEVLAVLDDVCAMFRRTEALHDRTLEEWAVRLAESAGRFDRVALLFAAAVQGSRHGAAERWSDWSQERFRCGIVLPEVAVSTRTAPED